MITIVQFDFINICHIFVYVYINSKGALHEYKIPLTNMLALNITDTTEVLTIFWVIYGIILFFIITWVVNILVWIVYITECLSVIQHNIKSVEYYSENVKELTLQLWKFRLLLLISYCEMFALSIGGLAILIHRIICFYRNDMIIEIVITYIHDFLQIVCLYLFLVLLKLLNALSGYLIRIYNWHQYKPDAIKKELRFILMEIIVLIIVAGTWIGTVPLGIILFVRVLLQYAEHIKLSNRLYMALRGVSIESGLNHSKEGVIQYRINKQVEGRYRKFAIWIIIGIFFWIIATGMSLLGTILNQANLYLILQHENSTLINEILSHKIYLIYFTDGLIFIGGGILFPVHVYCTLKRFTKGRCAVNPWCCKQRNTAKQIRPKNILIA